MCHNLLRMFGLRFQGIRNFKAEDQWTHGIKANCRSRIQPPEGKVYGDFQAERRSSELIILSVFEVISYMHNSVIISIECYICVIEFDFGNVLLGSVSKK